MYIIYNASMDANNMGYALVQNTGLEREMTCRSWGQYNYETFDGLYYYFPGKCSYTLVKDCEDNTKSSVFIQVHTKTCHSIFLNSSLYFDEVYF